MKLKERIHLWNEWHNPIYYWWRARKYFKFPKIVIRFSKHSDYAYRNREPFIGISFNGLMWKDKYNSPRHEVDPRIVFRFFRKRYLYIIFTYVGDKDKGQCDNGAVWEAMLDLLCYNKTIGQAYYNNIWETFDGTQLDIKFALTKKALELI